METKDILFTYSECDNTIKLRSYDKELVIAAITGGKFTDDPLPPCGNCSQLIGEE